MDVGVAFLTKVEKKTIQNERHLAWWVLYVMVAPFCRGSVGTPPDEPCQQLTMPCNVDTVVANNKT